MPSKSIFKGDFTINGDATGSGDALNVTDSAGTSRIKVANAGTITINDACNIVLGTTTGTKIATGDDQKLGFYNAAPIIQPATGGAAATLTGGGGITLTDTDTFDGYTLAEVVKALRNLGLLA